MSTFWAIVLGSIVGAILALSFLALAFFAVELLLKEDEDERWYT